MPDPHRPNAHAGSDLSPAELARYGRHLVLPEVGLAGQRRLKAASAVVVGTGGLGSPIALYLAAAGVGRIGLVDFDVVDVSNLQRQIIHTDPAVGTPKVESAAIRLRSLNPTIAIDAYPVPLTRHNALDILAGYDIILDGTDNFPTRYLLNDAAVMLGKQLIYGSIYRFEGQVSVFGAPDGPCYRCLLPDPPPPHLVPSCAEAGVLGVLPGTIGTIQATEAIKLLLGIGEPLIGRLLLYDAFDMSFDSIKLQKRPNCPMCGDSPTITELVDYEALCGLPTCDNRASDISTVPEMTVHDIHRRLQSGEALVMVDVREPYELAISRLDHTLHIPMSQIASRWLEIPRDQSVVIFCHHGVRSNQAIRMMQTQGYTNLINMRGGIDAWAREIDPSIPRY